MRARSAPRRAIVVAVVAFAAVAGRPHPVGAHALSPALLVLREIGGGIVAVTWKVPLLQLTGSNLQFVLPPDCPIVGRDEPSESEDGITTNLRIDCGSAGLVGKRLGVQGLGPAKTDALLHLELADGRHLDTVLRPAEPELVVPAREQRLGLARRYVSLGIEHILTGYDHLLFVFGLLLLAADWSALVATITAFTLGHSVTLTLAVLDIARVPAAPVEVLIAFSIFVLAVELARAGAGAESTLMRRRPWLMALTFGFLHGLGFAGTLRAAGLPADAVPLALLGFNVGIEIGQLAFVVTVLALRAAARPLLARAPVWSHWVPTYAMGSLAACWMIERARALF
jgi:HupE/UreJ protein